MIITNWTEMMWAEWANTTTSLLRMRGSDKWSTLWNETLDQRIDDVLRIYGVDNINLDKWQEQYQNALSESESTTNLHRVQTAQGAGTVDLQSLPSHAEAFGALAGWRRLRTRAGSMFRSNRNEPTQSQ